MNEHTIAIAEGAVGRPGVIRRHDGTVLADAWPGNPVGATAEMLAGACRSAAASTLVCWSGTLAPALFEATPLNFMPVGQDAGRAAVAALRAAADGVVDRILLRPHARHVLSDLPGTLTLLRSAGGTIGLALAPADLFEPSMLRDVPEHLERIFAVLGPHADLLLLHDVADDPEGDGCAPRPLGEGRFDRDLVRRLIAAHVPRSVPVVVPGDGVREQEAWLLG